MRWDRARRNLCRLEDYKACNKDEKRNEVDHIDWGIQDGPSDFGPRIRCERFSKADMGAHGKAYAAMVSYPAVNGKPTKDNTYGEIGGNHNGY